MPGGKVDKSACQYGGHGFDPWSGRIPRASEQLSLCTATTEPMRSQAHEPQLLSLSF